jgi:hypothetical protein
MITTTQGVVKALLEKKNGKKKDGGDWEKKTFLIETSDDEHGLRTSALTVDLFSGDGPVVNEPAIGTKVNLTLSITASQYNGKWFNHVAVLHFSEIQ